jgi:hypothetical protein
MSEEEILWQFNLSRAPWWGGQFERLIGVVKQSMYKTIGKANLTWNELQEVLLDLEITLNNRPLTYVEDDIEFPIITPNSLMFGNPPKRSLEENPSSIDDSTLRRRVKYVQRCKNMLWNRWTNEYIRGLRERHNMVHKTKLSLKEGDVVLIKGEKNEKNKGRWKLGRVDKLFPGRDGIVRAVRLRAGKSFLERPLELLYPLELSCCVNAEPSATSVPNGTPSAASVLNGTLSAASVPNSTPSAASVPNGTPSAASVPNGTPSAASVPNSTPSAASVLNGKPSAASVLNSTPLAASVMNGTTSVTSVINDTPSASSVINDTPSAASVIDDTPSAASVMNDRRSSTASVISDVSSADVPAHNSSSGALRLPVRRSKRLNMLNNLSR